MFYGFQWSNECISFDINCSTFKRNSSWAACVLVSSVYNPSLCLYPLSSFSFCFSVSFRPNCSDFDVNSSDSAARLVSVSDHALGLWLGFQPSCFCSPQWDRNPHPFCSLSLCFADFHCFLLFSVLFRLFLGECLRSPK